MEPSKLNDPDILLVEKALIRAGEAARIMAETTKTPLVVWGNVRVQKKRVINGESAMNKIFGIGLSRTGTTSLNNALKILGFKSVHFDPRLYDNINTPIINNFDAFTDNPIPLIYKKLDTLIPDCRFILTTRNIEGWLNSMQWMFGNKFIEWNLGNYPQKNMFLDQYG